MMNDHHAEHPLDVELLDFADGDLADAVELQSHLEKCLICRIRMKRIRQSSVRPSGSYSHDGAPLPNASESARNALASPERPDVSPGQVWLAGQARRVLVWVRTVRDQSVVAHPITLDIECADDSTLLVDDFEGLDHELAVVTSIVGTVPVSALVSCFGTLNIREDVDAVRSGRATRSGSPRLAVGATLVGPNDERREFLQLLADDIAALDGIEDADDEGGDFLESGHLGAVARDLFASLQIELIAMRGDLCRLRMVTNPQVRSELSTNRLVPVATVRELDCAMLVVLGEPGPSWALDNHGDALRLLSMADTSVLAICKAEPPHSAVVFEQGDLRETFKLPNAVERTRPRMTSDSLPAIKAIHEYLESSAFATEIDPLFTEATTRADLDRYFAKQASVAIEGIRSRRAQSTKNLAFKSLTEDDARLVAAALMSEGTLEDLIAELGRGASRD